MENTCRDAGREYVKQHPGYTLDDLYFYLGHHGFNESDILEFMAELRNNNLQGNVSAINIIDIPDPFELPSYILDELSREKQ